MKYEQQFDNEITFQLVIHSSYSGFSLWKCNVVSLKQQDAHKNERNITASAFGLKIIPNVKSERKFFLLCSNSETYNSYVNMTYRKTGALVGP